MRTLNLSGFKTGESLNISVSQNAITAGPANVSSWGGGDDGGAISIIVDRTMLWVAPDSVRFWVDLTEATFDTKGPTGDEVYDARMHDLIYLWDFGDAASGNWTAPENVLPEWKSRNTAKGPMVTHMYTRDGTHSASVLVIEPSSGKTATASVDIIVADPDVLYGGPSGQTICVNEYGDNDWTYVDANYPNAIKVNADENNEIIHTNVIYIDGVEGRYDAVWADQQNGVPNRWLFKGGSTFGLSINPQYPEVPGLYLGSYGGGKATITSPPYASTDDVNGPCAIIYDKGLGYVPVSAGNPAPDLRMVGLNVEGNFDPAVETPADIVADYDVSMRWMGMRLLSRLDLIISECDFAKFGTATISWNPPVDATNGLLPSHIHLDDCTLTDFGGQYPFHFGGHSWNEHSTFSVTGCRLAQNPLALSSDAWRAPIRVDSWRNNHMRGCDFFHLANSQTSVKLGNTPLDDGIVINVHSCAFEGGFQALIIGANSIARGSPGFSEGCSTVMNAIIDGTVSVMNYAGQQVFYTTASGATIRNNLGIVAAQKGIFYGSTFRNFVEVRALYGTYQGTSVPFDAAVVGGAPVRIYNNTLRVDRTNEQNTSGTGNYTEPVLLYKNTQGGAPMFSNVIEKNNLIHMPNLDIPQTLYSPVSDTALWSPRTAGWRPVVARHPGKLLGQDVPDGGTYFQPYWMLSDGVTQLARVHIKEGSDKHQLVVQGVGNGWMSLNSGLFEMRFEEAGVTITNRSGVTWPASAGYGPVLDMTEKSPLQTGYAMPESAVKDTRPLPGSAALGAALNGDVSYMDITLQDRPEPPSMGAWEAE